MWVIIEEKRIRHRWACADCGKIEYVPSWYYSEMGTPVCKDCDEDMEYVQVELEIETLCKPKGHKHLELAPPPGFVVSPYCSTL